MDAHGELYEKVQTLRLYLTSLPQSLPLSSKATPKNDFRNFSPDADWIEDIGEEGAVNRELEIRLGSRSMGPVTLSEHGPGLTALADVLEKYLVKYPESVILEKWLVDMIRSAELAFEFAKVPVGCAALSG
jgi:hypothetical protein